MVIPDNTLKPALITYLYDCRLVAYHHYVICDYNVLVDVDNEHYSEVNCVTVVSYCPRLWCANFLD
jgi:hypothetical protein